VSASPLLNTLHRIEDALLALLATALVLIAGAQIGARFFVDGSLLWADSLLKTLVLWLVMLGALAAARTESHLGIDALTHWLGPKGQRLSRFAAFSFAALMSLVAAYYGLELVRFERESPSDVHGLLPSWIVLLIIPTAFAGMTLRFAHSALVKPGPAT
jgi:TRAP-type C4-dicarboxylate transport system permease small subunit